MANTQIYGPYTWNGLMPGGAAHVWTVAMPRGGKVFAASAIPYRVAPSERRLLVAREK